MPAINQRVERQNLWRYTIKGNLMQLDNSSSIHGPHATEKYSNHGELGGRELFLNAVQSYALLVPLFHASALHPILMA